jgi:hypothetical protein
VLHPRALILVAAACSDGSISEPTFTVPTYTTPAPTPTVPEPTTSPEPPDPTLLSSTGLYADSATGALAEDVLSYEPTWRLWSDGSVKLRYLWLPPGTTIDVSDPAHWTFPVGAKLYKEFRTVDGLKLETRLIERVAATGDDDDDYFASSYLWREDQTDAVLAPDGAIDVLGTEHDVPTSTQCRTCHTGEPGFVLGASVLQLAGAGLGMRATDLAAAGLLSGPVTEVTVPGDPTTQAALGYLHANCGHCHNPFGSAWPDVLLTLQLDLMAASPEETPIWRDTVGVPLFGWDADGITLRVAAGDAAHSGLWARMAVRDGEEPGSDQMPSLGTERVDKEGLATVAAWIDSL